MPVSYEVERVHDRSDRPGNYVVASFYTAGTIYEAEAGHLVRSLDAHGVPYVVYGIRASSKDWVEVCQLKPHVIRLVRKRFPDRDTVWLDADSTLARDPEFFRCSPGSCAAYGHQKRPGEYMSGTVVFKAGPAADSMLDEWAELQESPEHRGRSWDQAVMSAVFNARPTEVGVLPPEYLKKFDRAGPSPVVVHWMASREYARGRKRDTRARTAKGRK